MTESRSSDRKLKPLPPDPARHQDSAIALERKLEAFGVKKVVPKKTDLDEAYRLFKRGVHIRKIVADEIAKYGKPPVPKDLAKQVRAYLEEHPECPWDEAIAHIAGYTADPI